MSDVVKVLGKWAMLVWMVGHVILHVLGIPHVEF